MSTGYFNTTYMVGPGNSTYIQSPRLLVQEADWVIVLVAMFVPLCWLVVGLRIYVRMFMLKAFGCDDWAILVTTVLFTLYTICLCNISAILLHDAVPLASGEAPISMVLPSFIAVATCLYSATMVGFKFSMGFFFLKIFAIKGGYVVVIWLTVIIPALVGVANIIYTVISPCEIETLFIAGLKSCSSHHSSQGWLAIAEVWTVLNALSDILYTVLSVVAIKHLQMSWKKKLSASVLCALGCIGCLASIIRLALLIWSYPTYSVLGEAMMEVIWSLIEPALGIIAASAATLRPLVRAVTGQTFDGSANRGRDPTNNSNQLPPMSRKVGDSMIRIDMEIAANEA